MQCQFVLFKGGADWKAHCHQFKGGPLPFAWDILSPQSQYGSIPFTKYPEDIPDYVKQSFPEGYAWERIMNLEDGAVCTVSNDSRYIAENLS